jgi:predicted alpha/beta superfamily hydrolase
LCNFAAIGTASAQQPGGPVVIGETVQLESKLLKESRMLLIARPAGYDDGTERYLVLYLLDAEVHFHYASGIEAFLSGIDQSSDVHPPWRDRTRTGGGGPATRAVSPRRGPGVNGERH